MPEAMKIATFSNEILRRLKTTHAGLDQKEVESILGELMDDLSAMGYQLEWREKVLRSALVGYMRIPDKVKKGITSRNRKGSQTLNTRRFKKLVGLQELVVASKKQES